MRTETALHIGDVARRTRVSPDTLRHYERRWLLPRAPRSPGGYRLYGGDAEQRVRVVQAALALGFTLDELATVLRERAQGKAPEIRPPSRRSAAPGRRAGVALGKAIPGRPGRAERVGG